MATLPQVARLAGVSTATAARALGGYGSVSEATRATVLAAARRLGYRANGLARSMITGTTKTLGVILSDIENPFFSTALRGVSDVARAAGFQVLLVNTDEDVRAESKAVRVLLEKRVDGLIVSSGVGDGDSIAHLRQVTASRTPMILLDRQVHGVQADTVGIDNQTAAEDATQRLLRLGHRRIALLTGASVDRARMTELGRNLAGVELMLGGTSGQRATGYLAALRAASVTASGELLSAEGYRQVDAEEATRRLLDLREPPTALIAADSTLALGVLAVFAERGVCCPRDISLIGFDDTVWAEAVNPPLSVVVQPVYEIGAQAAQLLLARIGGDDGQPIHRALATSYLERASTGALSGAAR